MACILSSHYDSSATPAQLTLPTKRIMQALGKEAVPPTAMELNALKSLISSQLSISPTYQTTSREALAPARCVGFIYLFIYLFII